MKLFGNKNTKNENATALRDAVTKKQETKAPTKPIKEPVKETTHVLSCEKYKNVDFSKVSKEKLFSLLSEVLIENRTLSEEINKMNEENIEYAKMMKQGHSREKGVEDKIFYIAQKIAPQVIIDMNKGLKFSPEELVNSIIENVLLEKKNRIQEIIQLKNQVLNDKKVLSDLKQQLAERVSIENERVDDREFTQKEFAEFAGTSPENPEIANVANEEQRIVLKSVDMSKIEASLDNVSKLIVEAIGKEGLSECPEIQNYCMKHGDNVTESKFETAIDNLESGSVVEMEKVKSFAKSNGVRTYSLSNEVGKTLYKNLFKNKPVMCEKERLIKEDDNLVHGYSIKDCSRVLESLGYEGISMDRKQNTFNISGAKACWIPDIVAVNPISGRTEYFEIEMGTHNIVNFNEKLDKANLKASILKIISPNKQTSFSIEKKVENWRAKNLKSASTLTIHVMTFGQFKEKEDGRVFGPIQKPTLEEFDKAGKKAKNK